MAPFAEREWGERATEMMWRIKALADPWGVLNPGVLLNRNPRVHLEALKSTPEVEETITKCIECGFCEPVCPSRNVTTTPRQRIAIRREIARQPEGSPVLVALREQQAYAAIETCAADGSCMHACPVGIDTGRWVKDRRAEAHGKPAQVLGVRAARRYGMLERAAQIGLRPGAPVVRLARPGFPPAAPALPETDRAGAAAVYMPACINCIFGAPPGRPAHPSLPEALVAVSARAGLPVWIPPDVGGHCCGTPWTSKGYTAGHTTMAAQMRAALQRWSEGGRRPVVLDATS
ncbi:MAG TPA: 4Fe-4S dicluster domain-containing protein [Solirubrobacteraceae bacterium]|nr:4Fe-4S dicluster domain-containing protein [Solirubrobacteraceae bacterium]